MKSQVDQTRPPQAGLRDRALRAGSWTLGAHGADLFVRFVSNLILTRLLFPEAFGAFGAALALVAGLGMISDFGVHVVIIQSPRGDEIGFLRSAWVFQICRGILVWLILAGICGLIALPPIHGLLPAASVFADRSFPLVTAALGFSLVTSSAESMSIPLHVRHLNYRPIVLLDLTTRLLPLPIMFIWAWFAPSVWAIVVGSLAGSIFRLVLSHAWVPGPRMALEWKKSHLEEIGHFGKWIALSSFGSIISQQFDMILLGIVVPGSMLGLYSIAKLLVGVGEGLLDRLNSSLALPILGESLRKNPNNLQDHYYRFRLPIELAAGLFGGGLFASGDFVVNFLYDARYSQAGIMLQILALGTVIYPVLTIRNAFVAVGDTHVSAAVSVLQAISLVACMTIGFFAFGMLGAVGGVALHRILPSVMIIWLASRRSWIQLWGELRVVPAFIVGALAGSGFAFIATRLGIVNIHQLLHLWVFNGSHE